MVIRSWARPSFLRSRELGFFPPTRHFCDFSSCSCVCADCRGRPLQVLLTPALPIMIDRLYATLILAFIPVVGLWAYQRFQYWRFKKYSDFPQPGKPHWKEGHWKWIHASIGAGDPRRSFGLFPHLTERKNSGSNSEERSQMDCARYVKATVLTTPAFIQTWSSWRRHPNLATLQSSWQTCDQKNLRYCSSSTTTLLNKSRSPPRCSPPVSPKRPT